MLSCRGTEIKKYFLFAWDEIVCLYLHHLYYNLRYTINLNY